MNVALDEEFIEVNPCLKLKMKGSPPRDVVWPDEAVDTFCRWAIKMGRRSMALAVQLGADLGLREGDIRRLKRRQYKDLAVTVQPNKTLNTTGPLIRVPVLPSLQAWLNETPNEGDEWVISETTGRPYTADNFGEVFAAIRAAAKIDQIALEHDYTEPLQFRDLRRTAVVHLGRAGCTEGQIGAVTGHSLDETRRILQTYLPRDSQMAEAAITKLGDYRRRVGRVSLPAPGTESRLPRRTLSPQRVLANELVRKVIPDGRDGTRPMTRAEHPWKSGVRIFMMSGGIG
jgi:integrase